jgi:hypothetical protein
MTHSKTLEIEKCAKINGIISTRNRRKSIILIKTRHNTLYWAMNLEDCEKYHLPK